MKEKRYWNANLQILQEMQMALRMIWKWTKLIKFIPIIWNNLCFFRPSLIQSAHRNKKTKWLKIWWWRHRNSRILMNGSGPQGLTRLWGCVRLHTCWAMDHHARSIRTHTSYTSAWIPCSMHHYPSNSAIRCSTASPCALLLEEPSKAT